MKYDREIVLSWLEEDNIQRAYFRLKPLLTVTGDAHEEAVALWPDDGALRIVPDKNEQGYFKDRMRSLGHFCLMDLTPFPTEANKIRTNKNYRPEREEHNQYILYSDAVKPLPEHTFYELLNGAPEDAAHLAENAITPLFMIRQSDTLFGPVRKAEPGIPAPASAMEAVLYDIISPDGVQHTILCRDGEAAIEPPVSAPVQAAEKPAATVQEKAHETKPACSRPEKPSPAAEKPQRDEASDESFLREEAPLPLGKPLSILDQSKDFSETLEGLNQPLSQGANLLRQSREEQLPLQDSTPVQQLTGTPLMRSSGLRTSTPRLKNRMQEVVANQWRAARNDPPAAPLPDGVSMRMVDNPVECACSQFQHAWEMPETQPQLVSFLLSLPGMNAYLAPAATAASNTPLRKAMLHHLDDLEAERLSALVQLDKAKENLEAFRKNTMDSVRAELKKKLTAMEGDVSLRETALAKLRDEVNALTDTRNALEQEIDCLRQAGNLPDPDNAAPLDAPIYLHTRIGRPAAMEELTRRLMTAAQQCHVTCPQNFAVALLAAIAVCPRIGIQCSTTAAAATLCENIAAGMGWQGGCGLQVSTAQHIVAQNIPVDHATPMLLLSTVEDCAPIPNVTRVMLTSAPAAVSPAYAADSWPIFPLPALPFVAIHTTGGDALSLDALVPAADEDHYAAIRQALQPLLAVLPPLSGNAMQEMEHFTCLCAAHMSGGLASACDWAILLWLLPLTAENPSLREVLRPLLEEYSMASACL